MACVCILPLRSLSLVAALPPFPMPRILLELGTALSSMPSTLPKGLLDALLALLIPKINLDLGSLSMTAAGLGTLSAAYGVTPGSGMARAVARLEATLALNLEVLNPLAMLDLNLFTPFSNAARAVATIRMVLGIDPLMPGADIRIRAALPQLFSGFHWNQQAAVIPKPVINAQLSLAMAFAPLISLAISLGMPLSFKAGFAAEMSARASLLASESFAAPSGMPFSMPTMMNLLAILSALADIRLVFGVDPFNRAAMMNLSLTLARLQLPGITIPSIPVPDPSLDSSTARMLLSIPMPDLMSLSANLALPSISLETVLMASIAVQAKAALGPLGLGMIRLSPCMFGCPINALEKAAAAGAKALS